MNIIFAVGMKLQQNVIPLIFIKKQVSTETKSTIRGTNSYTSWIKNRQYACLMRFCQPTKDT
jgi:hypothetical protein